MRFADTSFWFAHQDRADRRHADTAAIVSKPMGRVVTSNHVIGETWTLIRSRLGHSVAVRFLGFLERLPDLEVVHVDEHTEIEAWRWLRRHDERRYSFVDATSFALMRARRIREALAFGGDFIAAGFVEVRAT
ncbi:MAG: PIN domain-containing protein [Candidatus Dormibacteraeota bacterium]|nr:PIN domain-containing protein [Candidatus Dormibacteraeota bacterium]